MARSTIEIRYDAKPLQNLHDGLRLLMDVIEAAAIDTADVIAPSLLDELSIDPGPVSYPIEWQSEKQRRAFFATDGFGKGIPYQRTGELRANWEVRIVREQSETTITVDNPSEATPYVYGEMTFDEARAAQVQQKMHKNTGWPLAAPIAAAGLEDMVTGIADRSGKILGNLVDGKFRRGGR